MLGFRALSRAMTNIVASAKHKRTLQELWIIEGKETIQIVAEGIAPPQVEIPRQKETWVDLRGLTVVVTLGDPP